MAMPPKAPAKQVSRPFFIDRHLILRDEGGARHFTLRRRHQLALVTVAAFLSLYGLATSATLAVGARQVAAQEARIAQLIQENHHLALHLRPPQEPAQGKLTASLEQLQNQIASLLEENRELRGADDNRRQADDKELNATISQLQEELNLLREEQSKASTQLKQSAMALLQQLSATGLKAERILPEEEWEEGQERPDAGGPLLPMEAVPGEGVSDLLETVDDSWDDIGLARLNSRLLDIALVIPLARPVHGSHHLTSSFGLRRDPFTQRLARHEGLDFAATTGTPVYATAAGKVRFVGKRPGYGNCLDLAHDFGLVSRYAHLHEILVKPGERVHNGQRIALVGNTGRSTGPHLHYEVLLNSKPQNPSNYLLAGRQILDIAKQFTD